MFAGVRCCGSNMAKLICLNSLCAKSPFLCDSTCQCSSMHNQLCSIKYIEQITADIARVLKFQWLVIFSDHLKGQGIQIAGRQAKQTIAPPRNARFVLTYDKVPLNKEVQVKFKLTKINGCVGIGMFLKQTMINKEFRYVPQQDFMGHGAYMVLSNGFKYSHSEKIDNFKQLTNFQMKEGSIIHLSYSNKLLTFSNGKSYVYLKIPSEQQMHFGVYLYDEGDSIETVVSH